MNVATHIFKAYDIRGLWQTELSPELAYRIGRAFAVYLREKQVNLAGKKLVVGRDMRPSSVAFAEQVTKGILDEGIDAVDVGLVSTPLFNFACANYPEHAGGIMVTASHNPAEYNGFKMTLENGLPVPGKDKTLVDAVMAMSPPARGGAKGGGSVTSFNPLPDYFAKVLSIVKPEMLKPLKVVIDCGNGMAAATFPELVKNLPIKAEFLFLEPDGTFPNHEANPLKTETLRELQKKVVETGADFGFALDGDADRIGLVDERGEVVDASFVGALVGLEVLRHHPKAKMFYDLRSSMIIPEVWEASGGVSEMCMVGHANIKKQMKVDGAAFASELSLHLYYQDMYDVESSDLSLLYVLQMLSREKKPLSELVGPLKKYFHSGEINFEIENKAEVIERLEKEYAPKATKVSKLDGLWLGFEWGWFGVRASNTEPVLRLNLEAKTKEQMEAKVREISALIK